MRRVLVGVGASVLLSLAAPAVAAQDGPPTLTLDRTGAAAGEPVLVQGAGWSGTELVYVELCGNGGRGGSSACDQGGATLAGVSTTGTFGATIVTAEPPAPCPCVIKATSQSNQSIATVNLAVQDVPVVALEDQTEMNRLERAVEISAIELTGSGPWTTWLGAGASRTLSFTIENVGDVAVHDPPVTVTIGKGATPGGVVRAPDVGSIEPGESVAVEIPVTYDTLSFGRHSAVVRVDGFAVPAVAAAQTSTYPWALIAVGLVLLQYVLLRIRNRVRRRFERDDPDGEWGPDRDDDHDQADLDQVVDVRDTAPAERASTSPSAPTPVEPERQPALVGEVALASNGAVDAVTEAEIHGEIAVASNGAVDAVVEAEIHPVPAPEVDRQEPDPAVAEETTETTDEASHACDTTVVDLRDADEAAWSTTAAEAPDDGPAPDDDETPNPFDYIARHMAHDSVVHAARPMTNGHPLVHRVDDRAWIEDQRRLLEATFEEAAELAVHALAEAEAEADGLVAAAAAARDEAVEVLERARASVERLLVTAEEEAAAIRREAENDLEATRAVTEASHAEVARLLAEARTVLAAKMLELEEHATTTVGAPPEGHAADPGAVESAPTSAAPRVGAGFDSAIARAVQQALRG